MTECAGFQLGYVICANQPERRSKPRIQGPIPACVRGVGADGIPFDVETSLENLSAAGLFVQLDRSVAESEELSFVIRFPIRPVPGSPGMQFAARGIIRRIEQCPGGEWGLGVQFTRYRQI